VAPIAARDFSRRNRDECGGQFSPAAGTWATSDSSSDADMLHFDTAQMAAITQAHFFSRVAEFVRDQTTVAAYRQAALDTTLRTALWAPHWPTLRNASEHDAALFMCFLLACATLGVDSTRAAEAVRQSSQPETSMKLFLSERGLLRFSAFDVPDLTRPGAGA
jgi:hypothetical protein